MFVRVARLARAQVCVGGARGGVSSSAAVVAAGASQQQTSLDGVGWGKEIIGIVEEAGREHGAHSPPAPQAGHSKSHITGSFTRKHVDKAQRSKAGCRGAGEGVGALPSLRPHRAGPHNGGPRRLGHVEGKGGLATHCLPWQGSHVFVILAAAHCTHVQVIAVAARLLCVA